MKMSIHHMELEFDDAFVKKYEEVVPGKFEKYAASYLDMAVWKTKEEARQVIMRLAVEEMKLFRGEL